MEPLQREIPVRLSVISLLPDEIKSQSCPSCSTPMELHQPDSGFPERMLWTCSHCGTWFLMDLHPDQPQAVLVCLPDHGHFRSALLGDG